MPYKGSKKLYNKNQFIGQNATNKKKISSLETIVNEQKKTIKSLEDKILYNRKKIESLNKSIESNSDSSPILAITSATRKRRLTQPTNSDLNEKSKQRRTKETLKFCRAIHGASTNSDPCLDGMLLAMTRSTKSTKLAEKVIEVKPCLKRELSHRLVKEHNGNYYKSDKNILRSLNVYYSQDVMGKRKYLSVRKANNVDGFPNYVTYKVLANKIRSIDIGILQDINPIFTHDLDDDEVGDGCFRSLIQYAPRLAELYLKLDQTRIDKLKTFQGFHKKNPKSHHFLMAIGGDEAPGAGTSFLISFLNVGKRIASRKENYLLFGGNIKENGKIAQRYVLHLMWQIKQVESEVFELNIPCIDGESKKFTVEFKLELLPNDLKMLAFLAGELTNSAYYFTTFANVNQSDCNDVNKKYGTNNSFQWYPFPMDKRIKDAALVLKKKQANPKMKRNALTQYIAKELNSRQEYAPLVGSYIDLAKCEPLHLKNNCCKELFMKVLAVVFKEATFSSKVFKELPEDNLFVYFINDCVKKVMQCNQLGKKMISWFNESSQKEKEFGYRFRGRESFRFLQSFPSVIKVLRIKCSAKVNQNRLLEIFLQSVLLRKLVSLSVRIVNISHDDIAEMERIGRILFKCCCKFDSKITPSMWNFTNVSPSHARECFQKYSFGLGVNTMEGREAKHQQIKKYSNNTQFKVRWYSIFRHEYIQMIYLKENGFDDKAYRKIDSKYIPEPLAGCCKTCFLSTINEKCALCDDTFTIGLKSLVEYDF